MGKRVRNVSSLALALVLLCTCFAFAACSKSSVPTSEDDSSVLNQGASVPGADAEPSQESP